MPRRTAARAKAGLSMDGRGETRGSRGHGLGYSKRETPGVPLGRPIPPLARGKAGLEDTTLLIRSWLKPLGCDGQAVQGAAMQIRRWNLLRVYCRTCRVKPANPWGW